MAKTISLSNRNRPDLEHGWLTFWVVAAVGDFEVKLILAMSFIQSAADSTFGPTSSG